MNTKPAPWDHAANCAAVPASYAEAVGFKPRRWASIQEVPTVNGAAVLDRYGWPWVHLSHGWVRIDGKDSPVTATKAPLEESGPFTEPYMTFADAA